MWRCFPPSPTKLFDQETWGRCKRVGRGVCEGFTTALPNVLTVSPYKGKVLLPERLVMLVNMGGQLVAAFHMVFVKWQKTKQVGRSQDLPSLFFLGFKICQVRFLEFLRPG